VRSSYVMWFVLLCGCLLPASALAKQNLIGLRAGVNVSTLEGDEPADFQSVNRRVFGFVSVFRLTRWIAFQPEALISGKGAEGSVPTNVFGSSSLTGMVELNYFEIPLLLRVTPPLSSRAQPYIYAGPSVAANLSANATGTIGGRPFDDSIDNVVTDGDLGLVIGGGVDVSVSKVVLELDARYTKGLLPVDETRLTVDPKNRTWSFTLGLLFHVGDGE